MQNFDRAKLDTLDKQLTEWKCPDAAMMRKMPVKILQRTFVD